MTYEKKYKRALEEAKKLYGKHCIDNVLENLFPELKESEDERIRKAIKKALQVRCDGSRIISDESVTLEEAIAWLEKQGEQSVEPKWCHHKVDLSDCSEEYRKAYYDGWNNCNMQHSQCEAEKKELKKIPNALEECEIVHVEHGKYYYCIKDYYAGGNKKASKGDVVQASNGMSMMALGVKANEYFIPVNNIKQMYAWSEEDEEMLKWLCRIIHTQRLDRAITLKEESELGEWMDKWLNHNPQPKQCEHLENYDEEERIRKGLIKAVSRIFEGYKLFDTDVTREDCLAWLKKQGEQPTDKVETKFKVGNWITDGYIYYKITDILDDRYIIESKYDKRGAILFEYENRYHLWTIEDAKDGDILVVDGISIVEFDKHMTDGCPWKKNSILTSVEYDMDDDICTTGSHIFYDDIWPATKEDIDLLKKKRNDYLASNSHNESKFKVGDKV